MSRERPPRTDIPRNLSFIAALTERAYYRSQRPSLEEEPEVEPGEGGTRLGARSRAHAPSRGRRALSAPAGGGGVRVPRSRSPDTRKRVRFADALGLELAAVRRFRPGELPRVPRHVQVQLQRDALRHFAPCQPRARGLQVGGRHRHAPSPAPPLPGRSRRPIYQGTPISIPNPRLVLAHPFWCHSPSWAPLRLLDAGVRFGLVQCLTLTPPPVSPLLPTPSGGARRPRAGQRARLRRPLAGAAHLPGTRRGGPAGRGRERACAGPCLREARECALERRRLAEPTRGPRLLRRSGPAPAARGSLRLPPSGTTHWGRPAFRLALPRDRPRVLGQQRRP